MGDGTSKPPSSGRRERRRLLRQSKPVSLQLRWPVEIRREDDPVEVHQEEHDAVA